MRGRGHHHAWHAKWGHSVAVFYLVHRLQRRIFFLLGGTILTTVLAAILVTHLFNIDVHHRGRAGFLLVFLFFLLWGGAGRVAWRVSRPFVELARVAQEIGKGNLSARYRFGDRRGGHGEAFLIGTSINDMAERIERQLRDQRELLAAVSHEVRTPLARIRVLAELARAQGRDGGFLVGPKILDDVDREVVEIDALVGELLASARVDFAALTRTELDAVDVARRAMERQSVTAPLVAPEEPVKLDADPTLLARALANLLQNAVVHAGGVDEVKVSLGDGRVRFEVNDRGAGLPVGEEEKVFASFYRPKGQEAKNEGSLGLGLALVQRIAAAHGGTVFAKKREGGGASIGFELPASEGPASAGESSGAEGPAKQRD